MLRAYHRLLCERPVAVNTLTGSVLGAVGDVVAQRVGHGSSDVDVQHCARATAIAALMNGLWLPVWYRRLEAAVPGTDARSVVCKSAADVAVSFRSVKKRAALMENMLGNVQRCQCRRGFPRC